MRGYADGCKCQDLQRPIELSKRAIASVGFGYGFATIDLVQSYRTLGADFNYNNEIGFQVEQDGAQMEKYHTFPKGCSPSEIPK
jgi:hypothetical protein